VIATVKVGNAVHTATTRVNITNITPTQVLTNFSIHPNPGDSTKWSVRQSYYLPPKQLTVHATDQYDANISGVLVGYTSSDSSIAQVSTNGAVTGLRVGHVMIIARTTWYGVSLIDSIPFTIGMPAVAEVAVNYKDPEHIFHPGVDTISVGGTILWVNNSYDSLDIAFDDPSAAQEDQLICYCGDGNIPPFMGEYYVEDDYVDPVFMGRSFPTAGVYHYHSPLTGKSGTIVVVEDKSTGN
jgi:hypothetical protein